jgi:hypothetical protein
MVMLTLSAGARADPQTQNGLRATVIPTESYRVFRDAALTKIVAPSRETPSQTAGQRTNDNTQHSWVNTWLHTVDKARASQPHFTAPIVTTHVMLVQQY